ncbi:Sensor protein PfeS [compost metagenome]
MQLAWQDAERAPMNLEPIQVQALWDLLAEDASYESGWSPERLRCELPVDCWVQGNLNYLAQALENMLRNAIRHSPENGLVYLAGQREGGYWHLWLEDQGGGVANEDLERIIARSAIQRQGGTLWAENGKRGLKLCMRLPLHLPAPSREPPQPQALATA